MYKAVIEPNMKKENHESDRKKEKFEEIYKDNCPLIESALKKCIDNAKKYYNGDDERSSVFKEIINLKGRPSIFIPSLCPNYDKIISENCEKDNKPKMRVWESIPQPQFIPLLHIPICQQTVTIFAATGDFYTHGTISGRGFGHDEMLYRDWGSTVKYYNIA